MKQISNQSLHFLYISKQALDQMFSEITANRPGVMCQCNEEDKLESQRTSIKGIIQKGYLKAKMIMIHDYATLKLIYWKI